MATELLIRQSIEAAAPADILWKILTNFRIHSPLHVRLQRRKRMESRLTAALAWRSRWHALRQGQHRFDRSAPRPGLDGFDPNSTMADIPANYLTMTYKLTPLSERVTQLEITQGDFSKVENGQKRYQDSLGGFEILETIKMLAEQQAHSF
jgi:hypothetical protein